MSSALAVGVLLLLISFLLWIQQGLKPVVKRLQGEQVMTAYLASGLEDPREIERTVEQIRTALGAHEDPAPPIEVKYIGTQDFISHLRAHYSELAQQLTELGSEISGVVPRYISVSGILPESALEAIRSIPGIESVESSRERYRHIVGAFIALRWIATLLTVGVGTALLTGLLHLARTNAHLHQESLALLKLWGASGWTLRLPGVLSGAWVGVWGGMFAAAAQWTAGMTLTRHVRALTPALRDLPALPGGALAALVAAGTLMGLLAGVIGNLSPVRSRPGR